MKKFIILLIRYYQQYISHTLLPCCKYYPSCSEYAILSIERQGFFLGVLKSAWRIVRCNPFANGGIDVP